jgi:hypothetical protein
MTHRITSTAVLVLIGLITLGCQTYVNIPPQARDTANHNPNGKMVRIVMAEAIRATLADGSITGLVQVMLPENTDKLTYAQVINAIGDQAVSPYEEDVSSIVGIVFAKGVRIRGAQAEVDVARPVGEGMDQLVTVYLTWTPMNGWNADSVHVWRGVPIDESVSATE